MQNQKKKGKREQVISLLSLSLSLSSLPSLSLSTFSHYSLCCSTNLQPSPFTGHSWVVHALRFFLVFSPLASSFFSAASTFVVNVICRYTPRTAAPIKELYGTQNPNSSIPPAKTPHNPPLDDATVRRTWFDEIQKENKFFFLHFWKKRKEKKKKKKIVAVAVA